MATFSQLLNRFKAEQSLAQRLSQSDVGIAVEEERQDIKKARSDYQAQVEKAEREMAKKERKRGLGRLASQVVGTAVGLGTGNPLLGAKIAAGGTIATGLAVKPYDDFNGLLLSTPLFKLLNGNYKKAYETDDGELDFDDRPFLEKIEDMKDNTGETLITWEEFNAS